jgi:RHS repeat-associated protein
LQLLLEDLDYHYDEVDNPIEIDDFRNPAEWPAGSQPVTRKIAYDDLYRVARVDYAYPGGTDTWASPFQVEDQAQNGDPRRSASPTPHVGFPNRVLWQSFQYDWLGNTTQTDDDAHGFYDRSLGGITNGQAGAGPYQLKRAAQAAGTRGGSLSATYDFAGNLLGLTVTRSSGSCLPSTASSCSPRFAYDWDEVGRLVHAQRYDGGSTAAAAELFYAYDAGDHRTRKSARDGTANEVHDAYVFNSLELRGASFDGTDYARDNTTEVAYLFGHGVRLARLHYALASEPSLASGKLHVLLELPDHLGSTSIVVDRDTSELVERATYMGYGQAESDYRPLRWNAFREDYRFTGKEEDIEVGLSYFGKRFLSPYLGRWISADPLTVHALGSDLNAYAYVHGTLFVATDPAGLQEADFAVTQVGQQLQDALDKAAEIRKTQGDKAADQFLNDFAHQQLELGLKGLEAQGATLGCLFTGKTCIRVLVIVGVAKAADEKEAALNVSVVLATDVGGRALGKLVEAGANGIDALTAARATRAGTEGVGDAAGPVAAGAAAPPPVTPAPATPATPPPPPLPSRAAPPAPMTAQQSIVSGLTLPKPLTQATAQAAAEPAPQASGGGTGLMGQLRAWALALRLRFGSGSEGFGTTTLYHQGTLVNDEVQAGRTFSTSPSSDIAHYHPEGTLYQFNVPNTQLQLWREQPGLIQEGLDLHLPTGIVSPEVRFAPSVAPEMNKYRVR